MTGGARETDACRLAVAVRARDPGRRAEALAFAQRWSLPLLSEEGACDAAAPTHLLVFNDDSTELAWHPARALQPVRVDFLAEGIGRRARQLGRNELLLRACGWRASAPVAVLDATAGLGRDGFLLAAAGCTVAMVERVPWLVALVEDGLRRARSAGAHAAAAAGRITVIAGDARAVMACHRRDAFDVVYLDPMFPDQGGSALAKKELQLLQDVVGADPDADALLDSAIACARSRVVVKRPRHGPVLGGRAPSFQLLGKSVRFDVYLCAAKQTQGGAGEN